ncbi:MAG: N-acetylmuramoyl-L-alanine amidase [Gramella sp.]|nr:N-acetylmuramoyl-L-alanine amidase [Christiangramia sp.]
MKKLNLYLVVLATVFACSPNPYKTTNRYYKKRAAEFSSELKQLPIAKNTTDTLFLDYADYPVATTNFNLRRPNYVVIHHTAQDSVAQTLKTFTLPRTQVSAHYVIAQNGKIYHMLNDYYRAWHAGVGKWGNNQDLNSSSIGIELDNDGFTEFSALQIHSLLKLLSFLKEEYGIPQSNFIGHSDLAPSRKVDPNKFFPWKTLAENGYGYWYDEEKIDRIKMAKDSLNSEEFPTTLPKELVVPENFDPLLALRIIGYDISKPESAIQAFELHFIQNEPDGKLNDREIKILYNLVFKYL